MQVTDEMASVALHEYVSGDHDTPEQAMRAAITAALAKAWRPIESAPRDGTKLLWSSGDKHMAAIHWPEFDLCFEGGHWMPLPEPPATKEAGGR